MKNIFLTLSLLLFTTVVSASEVISRQGNASSNTLGVRCDSGKEITIIYNYTTEHYAVEGRFFDMYRHAVKFACK